MPRNPKVDAQGNHRCPRCQAYKPLEAFFTPYGAQRGVKSPYCKECSVEYAFIYKQRSHLAKIGVEAYKESLEKEQEQLKVKLQVLYDAMAGKIPVKAKGKKGNSMNVQHAKTFLKFLEKEFPINTIDYQVTFYESEFLPTDLAVTRRGTAVRGMVHNDKDLHVACGNPWTYDVLKTVAHEYRHILQADTKTNRYKDIGKARSELDAMKFGMKVAKAYCREHNIPIEQEEEEVI